MFVTPFKQRMRFREFVDMFHESKLKEGSEVPYLQVRQASPSLPASSLLLVPLFPRPHSQLLPHHVFATASPLQLPRAVIFASKLSRHIGRQSPSLGPAGPVAILFLPSDGSARR